MSKLIIANYKMNLCLADYQKILKKLNIKAFKDTNLVLCPPFVYLDYFASVKKYFKLGCQDIAGHEKGKFTGQVSAGMLKDFNVDYVIIGHSERRGFESDAEINLKVKQAVNNNLIPVICVGEQLKNGPITSVLNQVKTAVKGIDKTKKVIIAYEPVWAIGSGDVPNNDYINKKISSIKNCLQKLGYNSPVLYGGSVDDKNILEIKQTLADGFLCGTVSLNVDQFIGLIRGVNE